MCYTGKCQYEGNMGDCTAILNNGKLPCPSELFGNSVEQDGKVVKAVKNDFICFMAIYLISFIMGLISGLMLTGAIK